MSDAASISWQAALKSQFDLNDDQVAMLEHLLAMLERQRDRGLTAVTTARNLVRLHFVDSLWLMSVEELASAESAVDIGSGAGFPGLPLAIARPSLEVTMIEANRKKADFIGHAISELGLENARVLAERAEDVTHTALRASFDTALARAVGSLGEVLEYSLPLLRIGGSALLQRGGREDGDESSAIEAAAVLGGALERVIEARPYPEAAQLHLWVFYKTGETPQKYSRRVGIPRKRPLFGQNRS